MQADRSKLSTCDMQWELMAGNMCSSYCRSVLLLWPGALIVTCESVSL